MRKLEVLVRNMLIAIIIMVVGVLAIAEVPAVQTHFAQSVAKALQEQLGAEVRIGKVELSLFDRLVLKDVTLYDKAERELLKGKHLAVRVSLLDLAVGQVTLHAVELLDVEAKLYKRRAHEPTNFQFVLDAFASKDTTEKKPINLRINSVIVRRLAVSYDEYYKPERADNALDPAHLRLSDVYANISLKALREDSLNVRIRELQLKEKSGLHLVRLTGKAVLGAQEGIVTQLEVALPQSSWSIDTLALAYDAPMVLTPKAIHHLHVRVQDAVVSPQDLGFALPALRRVSQRYNLSTQVSLNDKRIRLHSLRLHNDNRSVRLAVQGEVVDWRDSTKRLMNAQVEDFYASATAVNMWHRALLQKALPEVLQRIGSVGYRGQLAMFSTNYHAEGQITTVAGDLRLKASLHNGENYTAKLESKHLDLKQITSAPLLGIASLALESEGCVAKGQERVHVKGQLPYFDFKGYRYERVGIEATWQPQMAKGKLSIDDPNLSMMLEGAIEGLQTTKKRLLADMKLKHARPQALGLNHTAIGDASIAMHLTAKGEGATLNDMVGRLNVSGVELLGSTKSYRLEQLLLTAHYDHERKHVIGLHSDFLRGRLRGEVDIAQLPKAFLSLLGTHLPSLRFSPNRQAKNDFVLTAKVLKADVLEYFLQSPVQVVAPIDLQAIVNERSKTLSLTVLGDSVVVAGQHLKQMRVFCKNYDDRTHLLAQAIRATSKGEMQVVAEVEGANDQLNATLNWQDQRKTHQRGSINAVAHVVNDGADGRSAVVSVLPSAMVLGDSLWQIEATRIVASKQGIRVDSLSLSNGLQRIMANGVYGGQPEDILAVRVADVDLAYIFDMVNFHAVDFKGRASVTGEIKKVNGTPQIQGKVGVKDFSFNDALMGQLAADAVWNNTEKQVDFEANIVKSPTERTAVMGYVSPGKNGLDLMIRAEQTPVAFLGHYLNAIFQDFKGKATGWTRLYGKFSDLNLEGEQVVDISAKAPALGVTYAVHGDTVRLSHGRIDFDNITLHDPQGNTAEVVGHVKHDHLRHITYDFQMATSRLQCYDTQQAKDEAFYGIVMGGGKAHLYGQPGVTRVEATIEAQDGTRFTYNASRPAEVSGTQLLSFTDRTVRTSHSKDAHPMPDKVEEKADLYLDFNIEAKPEAELHIIMDEKTGDNIVFHGHGQLRATYYNKDLFRLFGTYHIVDGLYRMSVKDVIRKDFRFQEGSRLVFRGPTSQGELNLHATYQLPSVSLSDLSQSQTLRTSNVPVECLLNITGQVEHPQVSFDLRLPTLSMDDYRLVQQMINTEEERNRQVIYLLSFGRFYSFDGMNKRTDAPTQDASLTAVNGFLSSTLSAQVNDMLGQALNLRNVSLGTNISTGDDGWNNVEVDGLLSGRFFNNRLVLDAVVGYRENSLYNPNASNFVGDFSLRWLINRPGTLSLKAYSETNDRYFIRSSLTTQGVGVIATKEFDRVSDLFKWLRRKPKPLSTQVEPDSVKQ